MTDFVDDNTDLPTASDAPGLSHALTPGYVVAANLNPLAAAATSLRTSQLRGKLHGLRSNPTASVSAAGNVHIISNAGRAMASENGGRFKYLLPSHVYKAEDYGAKFDGVTDDTAAIQACIDACATATALGHGNGLVQLPAGEAIISSTIGWTAVPGMIFQGAGEFNTVLRWGGNAGIPMLRVRNSQHWVLRDFAMAGSTVHPPSSMINSNYSVAAGTYVITGCLVDNVYIGWANGSGSFQRGIVVDGDDANNSELTFSRVTIQGFTQAGISLENSQVRAVTIRDCQINGLTTGLYGVASFYGTSNQGGDYACKDSGISEVAGACFRTGATNSRVVIDNITSEGSKRFFITYDVDTTPSPTAGTVPFLVSIKRSLWSGEVGASDGYAVAYHHAGPFVFEENNFGLGGTQGGSPPSPQILLVSSGVQSGVSIKNNLWNSINSVKQACYALSSATGIKTQPVCQDNVYLDASQNVAYRADGVDVGPDANWFIRHPGRRRTETVRFEILKAKFIAAAMTQTVALPTLPPHCQVREARLFIYDKLTGAGATTAKLGTSSGGNELLLAATVSSTNQDTIGDVTADLGATLASPIQFGSPVDVSLAAASPTVYLTLTSTTNLGNGTVTNLTTGRVQVILTLEVWDGDPY